MLDAPYWNWIGLCLALLPFIFGYTLIGLQKKVLMRHTESGLVKYGYTGWSWSYLIFGWAVPLYRGEIAIGLFHMILTFLSFGFFQLIMPFLYNKQYTSRLLTSGWVLADSEENNAYAAHKLGIVGAAING